jgi:hypothetical protein
MLFGIKVIGESGIVGCASVSDVGESRGFFRSSSCREIACYETDNLSFGLEI